MVDKQLAYMEQQFSTEIENWTTSTIQTCQVAIEQMDGLKEQLQNIKEQQRKLAKTQEDICERLEALECPGLPPIAEAEEEAASPIWHTADSAKLVPQSSVPRTFAETRDVWEKRGDSVSHTTTVLTVPASSTTEMQEHVDKPKRTPNPVSRFSKGKFTMDDFSSFLG